MSEPLASASTIHSTRALLRPVTWAVGLGVLAGFAAGPNLWFAAVLVAATLLNVHVAAFVASLLAALTAAWTLTPVCYNVGQRLLDQSAFGAALARLGDGTLAALLELDRYVLLGGLGIGGLLSFAVAEAAGWTIRRAAPQWSKLDAPVDVLRPRAWSTAAVAVALCLATLFGAAPRWLGNRLLEQAAVANGAEVTARSVRVDLLSGKFSARGLAISDPQCLSRDSLRIGQLDGSLRVGHLLRGRLHFDSLQMAGLEANGLRPVAARAVGSGRQVDSSSTAATSRRPAPADGVVVPLERYLADPSALQAWCQGMSRLVDELESLRTTHSTKDAAWQRLSLRQRRSRLGRSLPTLLVAQMHCEQLPPVWNLGQQAVVQLANVTSDPRLSGKPTRALIIAPATGLAVETHLNLHDGLRPHELRIQSHSLRPQAVCNLARLAELAAPSDLAGCASGEGWFDRDRLQVQLALAVPTSGLQLRTEQSLAGLPARFWRDASQELDRIELPIQLVGSLARPRLELDPVAVRQRFQQQLADAGQAGWSQALAEEVTANQQLAAQPTPQTVHPVAETAQLADAAPQTQSPAQPPAETAAEIPADATAASEPAAPSTVAVNRPPVRKPQPALAQAVPVAPVAEAPHANEPATSGAPEDSPSVQNASEAAPTTPVAAVASASPVAVEPAAPRVAAPVLQTVVAPAAPLEHAPAVAATPIAEEPSSEEIRTAIAEKRLPGLKGMQFGFDREATQPQIARAPQAMPPTPAAPAPTPQAVAQAPAPQAPTPDANMNSMDEEAAAPQRWFSSLKRALTLGSPHEPADALPPPASEQRVATRPPPPQPSSGSSDASPSATSAPAPSGQRQPVSGERAWKFWR